MITAQQHLSHARRTLRELGVVLAGPQHDEVVRAISASDLRRGVLIGLDSFRPDAKWWAQNLDNAWAAAHRRGVLPSDEYPGRWYHRS